MLSIASASLSVVDEMAQRRPIRLTQPKRRHGAMSTGELLKEQQSYEALAALLAVASVEEDEHEQAEVMSFVAATMASLEDERIDRTVIRSVRGTDLCFDHLEDEARVWHDFRFRKDHLPRLLAALRFPAVWTCKNGSKFPGETALLVLLRRLRCVSLSGMGSAWSATPLCFLLAFFLSRRTCSASEKER